ncbi:MAG: DUF3014 domain-containing protein [Candidatus Aminicenantes bacterium]|nr:DUF3014 domain-containing protein [Candidatus Aminicenantes bacterium]
MPAYQKVIWAALAVTVIAILVLGYFLFLAPQNKEKPMARTELTPRDIQLPTEPVAPATDEKKDFSPLQLDLDQSDPAVRELIAASPVPDMLREWSRQQELVRRVVTGVDNVAQGLSPSGQLAFLAPREKFSVIEKNGAACLDPRSYRRYDTLVNVFIAIPDDILLYWYRKLKPTLESAFRELGYPGITFTQRLKQAVEQLEQVPRIREDAPLEQKIVSYAFSDSELEDLTPAQKHLLRLGPKNVARIQKKLRAFIASI